MNRCIKACALLLPFIIALTLPARAQDTTARAQAAPSPQVPTPVERRAADVCAQFRKSPGEYEKLFAPSFIAQVSPDKLTEIFAYYFTQGGRCTQVKPSEVDSPLAGKYDLIFEQGYSVPA